MAEELGYLLAHSFRLASLQAMTTTDDRGSGVSRTVAAGWYRTFLADGAGNSHTDPAELVAAVQTALDASKWTVALGTNGRITFTYLGSGTGTISFSSATNLRSVLGLTGNIGPLATNASSTATYLPTHCVFAFACDPDTGWVDDAGRFAGAALPDGTVYGWGDGRASFTRRATFRALPKDWTARTSLGASGTPVFGLASRRQSPSTGEPGQTPPWGALDTLATAPALQCGVAWGDLQALIAGTSTAYELVYLAPTMLTGGSRVSFFVPGYDARRDFAWELTYAGEAER